MKKPKPTVKQLIAEYVGLPPVGSPLRRDMSAEEVQAKLREAKRLERFVDRIRRMK